MDGEQGLPRIGVLWRGDRRNGSLPRADRGLGPLYEAFSTLPLVMEPVPYADDATDEVREQPARQPPGPAGPDVLVRVQDARARDASSEQLSLGAFMTRCQEYFAWSGCLVDQVFQERLADGMLRCYFSHGQVVGFCRQWSQGLLDQDPHEDAPPSTVMEDPDVPVYQSLRVQAETQ